MPHDNPFADLATPDVLDAGARSRALFVALCTALSGGTADNDLLAGRPLFPAPKTSEATR